MARYVTFGRQPETAPKGMFREVHFPSLARLDEGTSEGMISRILHSDGADSRELPRTIYFQFGQAPGHDEAPAVGALFEMTVDGENGNLSGKGWLIDAEEGHKAALMISSKTLYHNSVDLAEVKVSYDELGDWWDEDFHIDIHFNEWKLAATTFVGKPAFANAHGIMPDELTAALGDGSALTVQDPNWQTEIRLEVAESDEEITASAVGLAPWELFHEPEPAVSHPIRVGEPREDGWIPVAGHLGLWNTCHDGIEGRCTIIPRPRDNYASFNRLTVLTDRGAVETGPICLKGGHVSLEKALDDTDNAWADVRVTPGVHGPWVSGVVRPGVDEVKTYAARASAISGHWKGDRLRVIVSVNAEGFNVPGSGFSFTTDADGHVDELVASYPGCQSQPKPPPASLARLSNLSESDAAAVIRWLESAGSTSNVMETIVETITETVTETVVEFDVDDETVISGELSAADLLLLLELEDEDD